MHFPFLYLVALLVCSTFATEWRCVGIIGAALGALPLFISCTVLGYGRHQNRASAGLCFAGFSFGKIFLQQCQYLRIGFRVFLAGFNQLSKAIEQNCADRIDNGQQKYCPHLCPLCRSDSSQAAGDANDNYDQNNDEQNASDNLNGATNISQHRKQPPCSPKKNGTHGKAPACRLPVYFTC